MAEGERILKPRKIVDEAGDCMGQCCNCGRETRNTYDCYAGEKIFSDGIVSYGNMEKCSDFLCNRCTLFPSALGSSCMFLVYFGIAAFAGFGSAIWVWWPWALAAITFGFSLYLWIRLLLDKRPAIKSDADAAIRRMMEVKHRQNPERVYFTSLEEYEKQTGGITP